MKKLILPLLILLSACGMTPREMITDCTSLVTPLSFVHSQDPNTDTASLKCYDSYKSCLIACYTESNNCKQSHEDAIKDCEDYKKIILNK